jgi:putative oxidoreductase
MSETGLLILRLAVGIVSVAHGAHTLFGSLGGPGTGMGLGGLDEAAARYAAVGLPGFLMAVLVGGAELIGGLLIAVGFMTRWAAAALAGLTLILAWKTHLPWGFFMNWIAEPGRGHGVEFSLLQLGAYICLALIGGGDWSLEGRRAKRASYMAAGRARLRRN